MRPPLELFAPFPTSPAVPVEPADNDVDELALSAVVAGGAVDVMTTVESDWSPPVVGVCVMTDVLTDSDCDVLVGAEEVVEVDVDVVLVGVEVVEGGPDVVLCDDVVGELKELVEKELVLSVLGTTVGLVLAVELVGGILEEVEVGDGA